MPVQQSCFAPRPTGDRTAHTQLHANAGPSLSPSQTGDLALDWQVGNALGVLKPESWLAALDDRYIFQEAYLPAIESANKRKRDEPQNRRDNRSNDRRESDGLQVRGRASGMSGFCIAFNNSECESRRS